MRHTPLTHPDRPTPEPARDRYATQFEWWTASVAAPVWVWIGILALMVAIYRTSWKPLLVPAVTLGLFAALAHAGTVKSRRVLARHGYLLCLGCRYPISGLGNEGNCPECGQPFVADQVERVWADQYSRRHPTDSSGTPSAGD